MDRDSQGTSLPTLLPFVVLARDHIADAIIWFADIKSHHVDELRLQFSSHLKWPKLSRMGF